MNQPPTTSAEFDRVLEAERLINSRQIALIRVAATSGALVLGLGFSILAPGFIGAPNGRTVCVHTRRGRHPVGAAACHTY